MYRLCTPFLLLLLLAIAQFAESQLDCPDDDPLISLWRESKDDARSKCESYLSSNPPKTSTSILAIDSSPTTLTTLVHNTVTVTVPKTLLHTNSVLSTLVQTTTSTIIATATFPPQVPLVTVTIVLSFTDAGYRIRQATPSKSPIHRTSPSQTGNLQSPGLSAIPLSPFSQGASTHIPQATTAAKGTPVVLRRSSTYLPTIAHISCTPAVYTVLRTITEVSTATTCGGYATPSLLTVAANDALSFGGILRSRADIDNGIENLNGKAISWEEALYLSKRSEEESIASACSCMHFPGPRSTTTIALTNTIPPRLVYQTSTGTVKVTVTSGSTTVTTSVTRIVTQHSTVFTTATPGEPNQALNHNPGGSRRTVTVTKSVTVR